MIISEISVTYKASFIFNSISNSQEVFQLIQKTWNLDTIELFEEFKLVMVNRANKVLGFYPLSKGGVSSTLVDPKILFSVALKCQASGIILAHNHPSGSLKPSQSDLFLTKKINSCCKLFDITLLDHLIVSRYDYYSFADNGKL